MNLHPSETEIHFYTSNINKFNEASAILKQFGVNVVREFMDIPEIQGTPQEVIQAKLDYITIKNPLQKCFVEDVSLTFEELNDGLPGPYIKDFIKILDLDGIYNLIKSNYNATAMTSIGFRDSNGKCTIMSDSVKGIIVEPVGKNGFGWDKIFKPNCSFLTFAQMNKDEKERISDRAKVYRRFGKFLVPNFTCQSDYHTRGIGQFDKNCGLRICNRTRY